MGRPYNPKQQRKLQRRHDEKRKSVPTSRMD